MSKVSKLVTVVVLSLALLPLGSFAQDRLDGHSQDHHSEDHHFQEDRNRHQPDRREDNFQGNHHDYNRHYVRHREWRRGHRMNPEDWNRGERIDYRRHHLRRPRRGYEWRQVDGNYVLAAVATGLISSVINASAGR